MRTLLTRFACLLGFHTWRSEKAGYAAAGLVVNQYSDGTERVVGQIYPRQFWNNRCARCGREVGPTWRYEKEEFSDRG